MSKFALKVTTPSDCEIVLTRTFAAPRQLVWDANTQPELLKRWLFGPPGWSLAVCEGEVRAGGTFRWVWRGPDGVEMAMRGVYREVVAPERIVRTETFEFGCEAQAGEQLATLVLTEQPGSAGVTTTLTINVRYPSKEARDGAVASGMEHGVAAGYDRLDEVLATVGS